MNRDDEEEGFLARWSRRKRSGDTISTDPEPAAVDPAPTDAPQNDPPPDETDEELLARLGLPDPETLVKGDDFSRFMSTAVPEHLRRRALRRLWRSNPTLAVLDGLNDYDDDFTGGFVPPGTLKTAYEVGKGIVTRVAEASEAEVPAPSGKAPAPVSPPGNAPENTPTNAPDSAQSELQPAPREQERPQPDPSPEPVQNNAEPRPARRRMAFRLSDEE